MHTGKGKKRPRQNTKVKANKKSKNDGADKIKRPLSAYLYFTKDFRAERAAKGLDNSKVNEVAKCAGEKWRSMSDSEKRPYELKAKADKERYQQQVKHSHLVYSFLCKTRNHGGHDLGCGVHKIMGSASS